MGAHACGRHQQDCHCESEEPSACVYDNLLTSRKLCRAYARVEWIHEGVIYYEANVEEPQALRNKEHDPGNVRG
eukprot:6176875-Pleurochrysis_carterae.AAC.1